MKYKEEQNGITMIALVVTIVVLIILAGISISGITGKNGIIKQGENAKRNTEIARYKSELEEIKHEKYAKKYTIEVDEFLSEYADIVLKKVDGVVEATPNKINKLVEVVTKEGYKFEVTIEDTIYVGSDENENIGDISKVKIEITATPEIWTRNKVKVKITSNVANVSKEYSIDGGNTWKKYEKEIEVQDNGTEIQARGVNEKNEKTEVVKKKIENIDRLAPNTFAPKVKGTTSKLEITASTTDKEATTKDGKSGIKGYKFSKDNGSSWTGLITEGRYTYENLQSGTTYPIKVKAVDNAGNEVETNTTNATTEEEIIVPDGEGRISFAKEPNGWTKGPVRVEISTREQGYGIEYSLDGSKYTSYSGPIEVSENKVIYARLTKGGKAGKNTTYVVDNIDRLQPKEFAVNIQGKTTNSIVVEGNTTDAERTETDGSSGIRGYRFSKDGGSNWTEEQTSGTYIFTGLNAGTSYQLKVKAIDNAGNERETAVISETTNELPNPQEKIQITKTPTNWTNRTVTVKMTNTATDYKIQYSKDDRSWQMYTGDIIVENNNETIYARLYNQDTNQATGSISTRITNIDRLKPNISVPTLVEGVDRIKVTASATDQEATGIDGKSGIRGYRFSKDGGNSWTEEQTSNVYTFGRLSPQVSYDIKVKAIDNAGNEIVSVGIIGSTEEIPGGNSNIYFSYSPSEWTNGNVTVTITASTEKYQLQYSKDGKIWNNYNSQAKVEMTENGPIYARLTDDTNYGPTATGNVGNIDKILPTGSGIVSMESQSAKEATINISAIDNESGVVSITNKTNDFITKENDTTYKVTKNGIFDFNVTDKAGNINTISVKVEEFLWEETTTSDSEWYSYNDVSNGDRKANVNAPALKGNMKPIKYVGPEADTQGGSKWANAMTNDGSMWVWIPRYAYKITEGYHTNQAGTIEIAFLDTTNHFLNGETGEITMNPEEQGAGQTKWLVHPAFTSNAEYGGGFGEIPGIWVGKFETTGEYTDGDASRISVKPGKKALEQMTINNQYKAGKQATYSEDISLNSHMSKNSEWGSILYLSHSKYGTNKQKVEQNKNTLLYTGGTDVLEEIYTINKMQSTTYNANGVYDLNGGAWERTAAYLDNGDANLKKYGGNTNGDLYGETSKEQSISTKYKTVYTSANGDDYELAEKNNKGDGIYETSDDRRSVCDIHACNMV
ncbi:MAG: chitobiase/beta-hexosaminidase C-terminal domain-containing protein [Clostridia bacterium]